MRDSKITKHIYKKLPIEYAHQMLSTSSNVNIWYALKLKISRYIIRISSHGSTEPSQKCHLNEICWHIFIELLHIMWFLQSLELKCKDGPSKMCAGWDFNWGHQGFINKFHCKRKLSVHMAMTHAQLKIALI